MEDRQAQSSNNDKLAMENCCAHEVIQSMFDHVSDQDPNRLENRADRHEIAKFSCSLVESELIFGSPSQSVLDSVQQKILSGGQKKSTE